MMRKLVELSSNAEFYGTIYAPEATVSISSNFEIFGAVAADLIEVAANVKIHFDEALKDVPPDSEDFLGGAWSVVGFPRDDWMARRTDPFRLLGVDRADLPSPAEAHGTE